MKRFQNYSSRLIAFGSLLGALMIAGAAQAQTCPSYPIALPAQLLANVPANTVVMDIQNGTGASNFGWLTWTGDSSIEALQASLTVPSDHVLNVGDWVTGKAAVDNRISMRDTLDSLIDVDIIVPVFDQVVGSGGSAAYHVAGFAQVRLVGYRLPARNKITVLFLGFTDCSGGDDGGGDGGGDGGPNV